MTDIAFDNPNFGGNMTKYTLGAGGSQVDFDTDGILAWGRWTGPVTVASNACEGVCSSQDLTFDSNQGLHYVVGLPTPVMPTTGTANYVLMGATKPTFTDGHAAPGTFLSTGGLSVNFGQQSITLDMTVSMPSDGKGWQIGGTTSYSGNAFSAFASSFSQGSLTIAGTTGSSCTSSCSASVQGFFAGTDASRVGLGYAISDSSASSTNVVGAAAFKKAP
jgi:hypothetical protein